MSDETQEIGTARDGNGAGSALALRERQEIGHAERGRSISAFASSGSFETAQRMAKALASSDFVPKEYKNNLANCLVAMELAGRTGASVIMVMQNLDVIHGRPSWRSQFLIAAVNSCGRFTPLRYEWRGEEGKEGWGCRAVARSKESGDVLEGEWITWEMAQAEGWVSRNGSKYKTMPGQMFRYRAATFWTRAYAPEIALGMHTAEEIEDVGPAWGNARGAASGDVEDLNAALKEAAAAAADAEAEAKAPTKASKAQMEQLTSLREKARGADLVEGTEDEEAIEEVLKAKDGAGVRMWVRELSNRLAKAGTDDEQPSLGVEG